MAQDTTINTDVLVIGGGLAGCWAAIRAKAFVPGVTLVDKAIVSRSGASAWAYYILAPAPVNERELWKQELVKKGDYLSNQDWVDTLLEEHAQRLADMESWGAPFERDDKGQLLIKKGRGHKSTGFVTSDGKLRMEVLKKKARELGVNILEGIMITELLTSDGNLPTSGSVIGAIGFHTRTGATVAFRSKSVIVASGPVQRGTNLAGDGTAMAFRAGADLMSMEFCIHPTCYISDGKYLLGTLNVLFQSLGLKILNSKGERFMEKYDPVLKERADWSLMAQALAKETFEGRGPMTLDLSEAREEDIDYFAGLHPGRMAPFLESGINLKKDRLTIVAQVKVSSGSGNGGIKIDTCGRTNIQGLYGAGSTCKNQAHGTYSAGGMNLAWCCTSGYQAGEHAAKDSFTAGDLSLVQKQIEALRKEIFAPLVLRKGPSPASIYKKIEEITEPTRISLIKKAERIKSTISDLDTLQNKELPSVRALDYHELVKTHEAKNLALFSKLTFRSALEREESRHSHYREDYPFRDDLNWLKWVNVKQDKSGNLKVWAEAIPFERYKVQPERRAIMPAIVKFDQAKLT